MRTAFMLLVVASSFASAANSEIRPVDTSEAPSVSVSVADLNLTSPEGVTRAKQRIASAARSMCYENGSNVEQLEVRTARHNCAQHAIADGASKLNQMLAQKGSGTALASTALIISGK